MMRLFNRRRMALIAGLILLLAGLLFAIRYSRGGGLSSPKAGARGPQVVYLSRHDAPELWAWDFATQSARQLTRTGGKVFDYQPSQDGSQIVYAAQNDQKGFDLWEIDRQGGQARRLLECGPDWCTNPAYAPDGRLLAYSRRQMSQADAAAPGAAHLWLLRLPEGSTEPLYTDFNVGGFSPAWSPDGRYLAFFDGLQQGLRVVEIQTRADFLLESETGLTGDWSPDSRELLYVHVAQGAAMPEIIVNRVDVQTRQVTRALGEDAAPLDFSVPAWSPDGEWVAVALRSLSGSASKQIWRMRLDGSQRQAITDNALYTHASYQWDPTGRRLVYQRLQLGSSSAAPEVVVWDAASGESTLLAEDAFQPRWLP